MTDFWDKNLETLGQTLPAIYDWVVMYPARPEGKALPGCDTDAWFADLRNVEWYTGLLFGFGDGIHVERLITEYPGRGLYVLEPDPDAFLRALHDRDLTTIFTHTGFQLLLMHKLDARLVARKLFVSVRDNLSLGKIVTLNWPPYKERWLDFWDEFHARITEHIKQDATNVATYQRYTLDWQRNVWANLPYAVGDPGVGALCGQFEHKPAILVASGPSLSKNMHLLREIQDKALIVAAGSAIEPLKRAGIVPHLVLSFDAGEQNAEPFRDLNMPTLPLVYSGVIYPEVVRDWQGPRWVMGVDVYPFETWLYRQLEQDKGEVSSGPSVANVAWDFLMRLGCDPIILVGQDLALTDNRTHADGVTTAADVIAPDFDGPLPAGFEWVDGIDGGKVLSTTVMLTFKVWFEQRIQAWREGQEAMGTYVQHTLDATEGGARIEGTEILPLGQAIDTYCQEVFNPAETLTRLHAENQPEPISDAQMLAMHSKLREGLGWLRARCEEGLNPLVELRHHSTNGASGEVILPLARQLAYLDLHLTDHDVHRQFLEPAMRQYGHKYTVLSNQLRQAADPRAAAKLLVDLYGGYFADTEAMVGEIERMF